MIINESSGKLYRYTDELYNPGDIINGIIPAQRNINKIVLKVYTEHCKYDFNRGYTYMTPTRNDYGFIDSKYVYEVQPVGQTFTGDDRFSIDMCNDEVRRRIKSAGINDITIKFIAELFVKDYIKNEKKSSVIAPKCKVIRRIEL